MHLVYGLRRYPLGKIVRPGKIASPCVCDLCAVLWNEWVVVGYILREA